MKRILTLLLLCSFSIFLFTGCQGVLAGTEDAVFKGVVKEINGDSVLVEVSEGEDILRSSDLLTFSKADLDDIGAEIGDVVSVTHTGTILETYPGQIDALSWTLVKNNPDAQPSVSASPDAPVDDEQKSTTVTAEYVHENGAVSLELPAEWEYAINDPDEDGDGSMTFWPKEEPDLTLNLKYNTTPVGICATGVTFTEKEFKNGLSATACTEQIEDEYWFLLMYDAPHEEYSVSCTVPLSLWTAYESDIMLILDSVLLS